jgi:hypothetical protein
VSFAIARSRCLVFTQFSLGPDSRRRAPDCQHGEVGVPPFSVDALAAPLGVVAKGVGNVHDSTSLLKFYE